LYYISGGCARQAKVKAKPDTTTTHETRDHSFAKYRKHPRTERIPLSEIAIKAARGKLALSEADARRALEDLNLHILLYTAHHAFSPFDLPPHHQDPQIIAQAVCEKILVVTCDERLSLYKRTLSPLVISLGLLSSDAIWSSVPA
jgi:PIN domain nuclease of toxin-antitoxin system